MTSKSGINILIGCTGSVATIKVPKLAESFVSLGYSVIIVPTFNAFHFLKSEAINNHKKANLEYYDKNCSACHAFQSNQERLFESNVEDDKSICIECEIKSLYPEYTFATDTKEWESWKRRGDPVKHIELRDWADILLLAPLDANTLAKIAQGLCDNLLTCIVRAWNLNKPLIFCPAMNTQMYIHPFTSQHINILKVGYVIFKYNLTKILFKIE